MTGDSRVGLFSVGASPLGGNPTAAPVGVRLNYSNTGAFTSALDIANRACQHCAVRRIGGTSWPPPEDTKQASEIAFVYDKVRRAELQRNLWTFATRRTILRTLGPTTMLLNPTVWDGNTVYDIGIIVADANSVLWISNAANNQGNPPAPSGEWSLYFGPLAVQAYDNGTSYFAGELVYMQSATGVFQVYISVVSGNTDMPSCVQDWASGTAYNFADIVTYGQLLYQSNFAANVGNEPDLSPAPWVSGTTYADTAQVTGSDGIVYISGYDGNVGNNPVSDNQVHWTNTGGLQPWTTTLTQPTGSLQWRLLPGAGVQTISIVYPVGAGPDNQVETKNVFLLPNGYLREAVQNPKQGRTPLGGPGPFTYNDWAFEGAFLISASSTPITLRFVADVSDVTAMHDMFCEGLAARVAMEVCEQLTNSDSRMSIITNTYGRSIGEARMVNAIEVGAQDPDEDDWITVRW